MATLLAYWQVEGDGTKTKADAKQNRIREEIQRRAKEFKRMARQRNFAR
jgi:hypothetical protein